MDELNTDYEVRQATLVAMGGSADGLNTIFEVDKAILKAVQEGGGGGGEGISAQQCKNIVESYNYAKDASVYHIVQDVSFGVDNYYGGVMTIDGGNNMSLTASTQDLVVRCINDDEFTRVSSNIIWTQDNRGNVYHSVMNTSTKDQMYITADKIEARNVNSSEKTVIKKGAITINNSNNKNIVIQPVDAENSAGLISTCNLYKGQYTAGQMLVYKTNASSTIDSAVRIQSDYISVGGANEYNKIKIINSSILKYENGVKTAEFVTDAYVDSKIGDINTALAAIIGAE